MWDKMIPARDLMTQDEERSAVRYDIAIYSRGVHCVLTWADVYLNMMRRSYLELSNCKIE